MFYLDLTTDTLELICENQHTIETCIGIKPIEGYKGETDHLAVINSESFLKNLQLNLQEIAKLKRRGLIVTT